MGTNINQRHESHDGLLTVADEPHRRERLAPGERLRKELRDLDSLQNDETRKRTEERQQISDDISTKSAKHQKLLSEAQKLKDEIDQLKGRLEQLPDEAAGRAQLVADRLAAFGRVLRSETHTVGEMLNVYTSYRLARTDWEAAVTARPDLEESRRLLDYEANSPAAIAALDDVLRGIIDRQLASARDAVASVPEPTRPPELAPIYACVAPAPGVGSVITVVLPTNRESFNEGHPHARFVAEILAAMSQALLEGTDADAPVVLAPTGEDDPLRGTVLVGATCGTDTLDAELFGVTVQELLASSQTIGVEVQAIDDVDLAGALTELVRRKAEAR